VGTGEAIAAPTPGTGGAPSPVTPVIGAALMNALGGDLGGDGKNEDPEAKAYLKGVLRMLYDATTTKLWETQLWAVTRQPRRHPTAPNMSTWRVPT
jgi:hypothetical protein